jgi:hypothetical protein
VDTLERLKEAYQEAKKQLGDNAKLSDIRVNVQTGDFSFIWDKPDKTVKE